MSAPSELAPSAVARISFEEQVGLTPLNGLDSTREQYIVSSTPGGECLGIITSTERWFTEAELRREIGQARIRATARKPSVLRRW